MELWKVILSYEAPGDRPSNRIKDTYILPAEDKEEARDKAYEHFFNAACNSWISPEEVNTTVRKIAGSKIKFPQLTLPEDERRYQISAKVSKDGSYLEYLVSEKSE